MRRVTWSILAGLGVFLIVLALLSHFVLPGRVVKFALNEYSITYYQGSGVSYFSAKHLQEVTGATVLATQTVKGDMAAAKASGKPNVAVWKSFTATQDVTHHEFFDYSTESLGFDRKTGALVNCCGNSVGTNQHLQVSGQGYQFPLGTAKQDYQVFDTTLLKPVTFHYSGTATTGGIPTYKFVATVPHTQVGTQELPGSLVGDKAAMVTLPEFYANNETYYVDPVTGTVVSATQAQRLTLEDGSGNTKLVLLDGTLSSTQASIAGLVSKVQSKASLINLIEVILPLAAGILGLVLLVAGVLLGMRAPAGEPADEEDYEELNA